MDAVKIDKHIDVLDGVRAFAIGLVVWYHFWQQSWLTPRITFPVFFRTHFGMTGINIEGFVRCGFVFVDLLILLSAFCNFYPYARSILLGEPWVDTKTFYKKRAARILPSYCLCLLITVLVSAAEGSLQINGFFWKDLAAHLTCTAPLFPETYLSVNFNGVLWTVQIEVLYYILMPWLAKLFRKAPVVTFLSLWLCGIASANYIVYEKADQIRVLGNHILTFAGCYANGMLLCMLYITIKGKDLENRYTRLAASVVVVGCLFHLSRMIRDLGVGNLQIVQLKQRFELSLVFSCFILALPLSCRGFKVLFANKLMTFLAGISYNLYIWHQYIAVKLKVHRIPFWEGDVPPNMSEDKVWMWKYQILIVAAALAAAVVMTYAFERPVAKRLLNSGKQKPAAAQVPEEPSRPRS